MKRPVVVLGAEPRISLAIARSLHSHDVTVDIASLSHSEPEISSRSVRRFTRLAGKSSRQLYLSLAALISHEHYDMLVPATDAALAFVGEHEKILRTILAVACPAGTIVEQVLNKSRTIEIAAEVGVGVPRSLRVLNLDELEAASRNLKFPVAAKPYHKSAETDFKVKFLQDADQLRNAFANGVSEGVLLQEFVPGEGVGVEILIHRGEPLVVFQHRRLKEVPSTGGAAAVAISERPEPFLVDQALRLLRALEWEGVAMVEFRYDRAQKRSGLMEVNGRYWGTLDLAIQSGIDFPWYEWQLVHGVRPTIPPTYSTGVRSRWTAGYLRRWHGMATQGFKNVLKHPITALELFPAVRDLSPFSHDVLWRLTDPMAAISETTGELMRLIKSDVRSVARKALRPRTRKVAIMPRTLPTAPAEEQERKIGV